jgi:hypothetical protein
MLLGICCLCGCEVKTSPPISIATQKLAGESGGIGGKYKNLGETSDGNPAYLASMLTLGADRSLTSNARNEFAKDLLAAKEVGIKLVDGDSVKIELDKDGGFQKWNFFKSLGQLEGSEERIAIKNSGDTSDVNTVSHSSISIEVWRQDDCIVVHRYMKSVGVMLLVPVYGKYDIWARFSRLKTVSERLNDN